MSQKRVILLFPQADNETGLFIKNAFHNLDWTTACMDPKMMTVDTMIEEIRKLGLEYFDLVLTSRTAELSSVIRYINNWSSRPKTCCWNVDAAAHISDRWKGLYSLMTLVDMNFVVKGSIEQYKSININNVHPIQQGIDATVHNRPDAIKVEEWQDVTFLGSIDQFHEDGAQRASLMTAVAERFTFKHSNNTRRGHASYTYYRSKINLGNSCFPQIDGAISVRDYKIMGAGGFLLTNRVRGMERMFKDRNHCVYYDSIPDCIEKIDYYLRHTAERERIANSGYREVHAKHTYTHRIEEIIKVMGV